MKNFYLLIAFCLFSVGYAQNPIAVGLDMSFNHKDEFYLNFSYLKVKELPNGKIIVLDGGDNKTYLYARKVQTLTGQLYRLNADLTIDNTFKSGLTNLSDGIKDFDVYPDGRIVAVGTFNTYNGVAKNKIVRLFENGDIDNSYQFSTTGYVSFTLNKIESVKVLSNNSILVSGGSLSFRGTNSITRGLAKIDDFGRVDFSFTSNIIANSVNAYDFQSDGKLIVLNSSYIVTPFSSTFSVKRLNINGSDDTTFSTGNIFGSYGYYTSSGSYVSSGTGGEPKIIVQPGDKILISGNFSANNRMVRLNVNGALDNTFLPFQKLANNSFLLNNNNTITAVFEQSSNKISKINDLGGLISQSNPELGNFDNLYRLNNGNLFASAKWTTTINNTDVLNSRPLILSNEGNEYTNLEKSSYFPSRKIVKLGNSEILLLGSIKNRGFLFTILF
ncbi:hypothetical protein [Flavobacterium sp.]|uniref:hypothetical protein n=1 Tax=Flavobacterium sp. TaxID=239 RepID=UPI003752BB53